MYKPFSLLPNASVSFALCSNFCHILQFDDQQCCWLFRDYCTPPKAFSFSGKKWFTSKKWTTKFLGNWIHVRSAICSARHEWTCWHHSLVCMSQTMCVCAYARHKLTAACLIAPLKLLKIKWLSQNRMSNKQNKIKNTSLG